MTSLADCLREWSLRYIARPQPGQTFVPQIDGLRFVAIMAVLLYHIQGYFEAAAGLDGVRAQDPVHALFALGFYGVPLFFAISGYIIARPFLAPREISLGRYFLRRITRLEPPYIINLLLVFALKMFVLGAAFPDLLPHLLASLVYAHGPIFGTHSEVNGVAWSLEVEWQFYLCAPLMMAALARSKGASRHLLLALMVVLGGVAYVGLSDMEPRLAISLARYFGFFIAGVWVAVMDQEDRLRNAHAGVFDLAGISATALILAALFTGRGWSALLPLLTFLLVLCALRGRHFGRALGWWPVHCIGAMCYSIYLYHFFVVSALGRTFLVVVPWSSSSTSALLTFASVVAPLTLMACVVPYVLIERPFMVWRPGQTRFIDAFRFRRSAAPELSSPKIVRKAGAA